jgi:hypothetical protein
VFEDALNHVLISLQPQKNLFAAVLGDVSILISEIEDCDLVFL